MRGVLILTRCCVPLFRGPPDLKPENILLTCQACEGEVQPAESSGSRCEGGRCRAVASHDQAFHYIPYVRTEGCAAVIRVVKICSCSTGPAHAVTHAAGF